MKNLISPEIIFKKKNLIIISKKLRLLEIVMLKMFWIFTRTKMKLIKVVVFLQQPLDFLDQ